METLERELEIYRKALPSLVAENEGKHVLICDGKLIGTYDSYEDALKVGYEKCGVQPFLVKKISAVEQISYFTRDLASSCHI